MFKYILFDLDGTLTDPKEGICKSVQYALKKHGIDEPNLDKLEIFIGPPLMDSFRDFYHMDDDEAAVAVADYRERFSSIGLYENELYKGIDDMLINLKKCGMKLAVASSKPEVFVKKILKHFKIQKYFDVVVGSELDGRRSDKSEVVEEALKQLFSLGPDDSVKDYIKANKAISQETAMVGDRKFDVKGAKDYALTSVAVRFGYAPKGELEAAAADYIAGDVEDLERFLLTGEKKKRKRKEKESRSGSFFKAVNVIIPLVWYYVMMMAVTFVALCVTNGINNSQNVKLIDWLSVNSGLISAVISLLAYIIAAITLILLGKKQDPISLKVNGGIPAALLAGVLMSISLNVFAEALMNNLGWLNYETPTSVANTPFILAIVIYIFITPTVEELLFRWLMYGRMKKMLGKYTCIFVSAMFFGFYHGNLVQGIYAFLMGLFLATVYEWTGTILVPIAFHLGANAAAYLGPHMPANFQRVLSSALSATLCLIFGLIITAMIYIRKEKYNV